MCLWCAMRSALAGSNTILSKIHCDPRMFWPCCAGISRPKEAICSQLMRALQSSKSSLPIRAGYKRSQVCLIMHPVTSRSNGTHHAGKYIKYLEVVSVACASFGATCGNTSCPQIALGRFCKIFSVVLVGTCSTALQAFIRKFTIVAIP